MTEEKENMDKKVMQQKNMVLQKKNGGHDVKRYSQKSSKKTETKPSSWSPSLKHQLADNRYQGRTSRGKARQFQEAGVAKGPQIAYDGDDLNKTESDCVDDGIEYRKLLNFKYEPPTRFHVGSAGRKYGRSWNSARSPVYNKETYLQANCQFVVKEKGDYRIHVADPDVLVEWDLIEQVHIFSHEMISCPICLDTPIAAKITKCGHVYCWSCVLHYLQLSDKPWRKCPICYEAILPADLKSVVTTCTQKFGKGEQMKMRLMKRKKGSALSWPISCCKDTEEENFKQWKGESDASHSKLVISNPQTVYSNIIMREMNELEEQLRRARTEKSGEECFIESALVTLKEKEREALQDIRRYEATTFDKTQKRDMPKETPVAAFSVEEVGKKISTLPIDEPAFSDDEIEVGAEGIESAAELLVDADPEVIEPASVCSQTEMINQEKQAKINDSDYFYFYQAEDGQNIFLHPLNIRCLIHEYGSLGECPETISAQIIDIEHYTMNKDLRKRYRFLSHLPVTCGFSFCELMLRPPILSRETISEFSQDFHNRKMQRQKKKREERKQDQRMESRKTMDMFGREIQRPVDEISWDLESNQEFPSQSGESLSDYPSLGISSVSPNSWGSSSFAQALQNNSQPAVPTKMPIGKPKLADNTVRESGTNLNSDGEVDEDYVPVPSFSQAFSDALSASWRTVDSKEEEDSRRMPNKGNKKKQKEKKLLFSTGGFMKY